MAEFHELGEKGEDMAVGYLRNNGYKILETNWRKGSLEVDIIAQKDDILVIAEVKTRSTNYFGEPEEFVTKAKQKNLIKAANIYIQLNNLDVETRFDIISVLIKGDQHKVHHIEDAFYPTL
ncbi:MAG: YraN family protein [Bacteroidales bacterium]|nr:YraN family protein [Bacteroidales bacterium]